MLDGYLGNIASQNQELADLKKFEVQHEIKKRTQEFRIRFFWYLVTLSAASVTLVMQVLVELRESPYIAKYFFLIALLYFGITIVAAVVKNTWSIKKIGEDVWLDTDNFFDFKMFSDFLHPISLYAQGIGFLIIGSILLTLNI